MIFATIANRQPHDTPPAVPMPADNRINAEVVIRLHSDESTPVYFGKVKDFQTKFVWRSHVWAREEWALVRIPGVGKRWVPPSYFVKWA